MNKAEQIEKKTLAEKILDGMIKHQKDGASSSPITVEVIQSILS